GGADYIGFDAKSSTGGQAVDLLLWGSGLDSTVTADQIRLLGPGITLRPSTLHTQMTATVYGSLALRFTVDLAAVPATAPVTIAVVKGTDAGVYSGGFVILGGTADCAYTVSSKQVAAPAAGGSGTVTVTTGAGCPWTAASDSPWLKITSITAASGNGSVSFAADPNTNAAARSGALAIAGQSVVVIEA